MTRSENECTGMSHTYHLMRTRRIKIFRNFVALCMLLKQCINITKARVQNEHFSWYLVKHLNKICAQWLLCYGHINTPRAEYLTERCANHAHSSKTSGQDRWLYRSARPGRGWLNPPTALGCGRETASPIFWNATWTFDHIRRFLPPCLPSCCLTQFGGKLLLRCLVRLLM